MTEERAMRRSLASFASVAALLVAAVTTGSPASQASTRATDALVSVASPQDMHPQNTSNEPALAVDPTRPNILAAGANELIDMQPCSEEASTTAGAFSFPLG